MSPRRRLAARRYVVREVTYSFGFHGNLFAVGCTTQLRGVRAFERRVAKNLLESGDEGAVMLFDRVTQEVLAWTAHVVDPKAAGRYWFGAR